MKVIVADEIVGAKLGGDGRPQVVERRCNTVELGRIQVAEDRVQAIVLDRLDLLERLDTTRRDANEDHPSIVRDADAFDETSLLHAIDDARGIAERHVEQLGHTAHRQIAVMLEQPHDMHVGHADAGLDETTRTGAAESRDHVVDAGCDSRLGRVAGDSCGWINSSHDVNNLAAGNHHVNMQYRGKLEVGGGGPVRFALMIEPQQGFSYAEQLAIVRRAEAAGFESFFRSDHYQSFPGPEGEPTTDAWTVLAGLARETTTIGLGVLVSPVTFRHAGSLAKVVTTVDEMSGGRVEFGVGAGWNDVEHRQLGLPFPPIEERADLLEDNLAILHGLWGEPDGWSYAGKQLNIDGARFYPKPVDVEGRPRLPNGAVRPRLLVGGGGTPRSMRIAARYADEFNLSSSTPDQARQKYAELTAACEAIGRDPSTITRSTMAGVLMGRDEAQLEQRKRALLSAFGEDAGGEDWIDAREPRWVFGTPAAARAMVARFEEAGAERIMLQNFIPRDLEMIDLMAEVLF